MKTPVDLKSEHALFQAWLRSGGAAEIQMSGSVSMDGVRKAAWAGWIAALTAARGE